MKDIILGIIGLALLAFVFINSNKKEVGQNNINRIEAPGEQSLTVGQTGIFSDLSITFNEFIADYRCPADAQCIEGGAVVVNLTLKAGEEEVTMNKASDEAPLEFSGYKISITNTSPLAMSGKTIEFKDYVVTFFVEPMASAGIKEEAQNTSNESSTDLALKLSANTWIWDKTVMSDGAIITPNKIDSFTLTFTEDGNVSGKTDCNGFGGSYELGKGNTITFGPFMSTLMYCDGSQEAVFSKNVSDSNMVFFTEEGNLVLLLPYDSGSVIFKK